MKRLKHTLLTALCASGLPMANSPDSLGQDIYRPYEPQASLDTNPFAPDYNLDWYSYDWSLGSDEEDDNRRPLRYRSTPANRSRPAVPSWPRAESPSSYGRAGEREYFSSPSTRSGGVNPRFDPRLTNQREPRQTLSGRIIDFRSFPDVGSQAGRTLRNAARIRLRNGNTAMVDMGLEAARMRDVLAPGDQIMALGRSYRVNGRQVLVADRILANDWVYELGPSSRNRVGPRSLYNPRVRYYSQERTPVVE